MEREDIIRLVRILSANYRKWPEEGKEDDVISLWDMMLSDLSLDVAKKAVQYHLSRSVYPPTVADIREAAAKVSNPRTLDWIEAWEKIGTAIRRFGFYREKEALESMPDEVARMAKQFTWRELCLNENIDTLRAQFRMAWETQTKRNNEQRILPLELMDALENPMLVKRLV
ncbi:replicative helicase loader/inhibitor [Paenibacillus sp. NEAU-GSW1]|uniref:replicative helicase loader/inhibitor n=1 Tax=Paenibacillus sp. NEAU-GSW1 TaxID=2682486 RepID=UPI0012E28415|nr:replicative helicase loader/inhibitor [Paenibacillus sp. NEAU-GSW1]MUT66036.1 hypothetical protein [Paenibacillus sp. NEAU-GSW1]